MANKKISELTELSYSELTSDDITMIVDINSDGTGLPETKMITMSELSKYLSAVGGYGSGNISMRNTSTDNVPLELFVDGLSVPFYLGDNKTVGFEVSIVGRRIDIQTENCYFTISGLVVRGTGDESVSIIGTPNLTVISRPNSNWSASVDANTSNGSLRLMVTGEYGKSISWLAIVRYVEING